MDHMGVKVLARIARIFGMTDETWRRHANPWSVYTRFAAIPAMILAIWSRAWIGWWAFAPVAVVVAGLWLNPRVFSAVAASDGWAAKGIHGEKMWLLDPSSVPSGYRAVLRWLVVPVFCGAALLAWGLVQLRVWPTVFGATLIILAQLWRIDRLGLLYELNNGQQGVKAAARREPCP